MNALGPIKRHKTLTEQAADAIRTRIIAGQFQFGEALSEIALATELGVSKTPVREAFLQLKNEGLVEILPQRGTFVFQMSGPQLRQLTEMRELLEVNALRFAVRRGGEAFSRTLDRIIEAMTKTVEDQDPVAYRLCDAQFHQAIIDGCGNPFIGSAYNIIALRVQAFRNRLSLEAQNWRSLDEHREVARFAKALDADAAANCLLDHIRGAINDYFARTEKEFSRVG